MACFVAWRTNLLVLESRNGGGQSRAYWIVKETYGPILWSLVQKVTVSQILIRLKLVLFTSIFKEVIFSTFCSGSAIASARMPPLSVLF